MSINNSFFAFTKKMFLSFNIHGEYMAKKIAVVGATGLVGRTVVDILSHQNIEDLDVYLFASKLSHGKILKFSNTRLKVCALDEDAANLNFDYVLMCTNENVSKKYVPLFSKKSVVIDFSSQFRHKFPLIVPQINFNDIKGNIICNPNCSTVGVCMALNGIAKTFGLEEITISTYQSLSGAGQLGLLDKFEKDAKKLKKLDYVIDNNLIPYIGKIENDGFCTEEHKLMYETKKILHLDDVVVRAQTTRVPIDVCHGESIFFKTKKPATTKQLCDAVVQTKNCKMVEFAMPILASGKDDVLVSRIRQCEDDRHFCMFVTIDNLRKGAAQNGVEILLKYLGREYV